MSTTITKKDASLLEYIESGQADKELEESPLYNNMEDFINSMK